MSRTPFQVAICWSFSFELHGQVIRFNLTQKRFQAQTAVPDNAAAKKANLYLHSLGSEIEYAIVDISNILPLRTERQHCEESVKRLSLNHARQLSSAFRVTKFLNMISTVPLLAQYTEAREQTV